MYLKATYTLMNSKDYALLQMVCHSPSKQEGTPLAPLSTLLFSYLGENHILRGVVTKIGTSKTATFCYWAYYYY